MTKVLGRLAFEKNQAIIRFLPNTVTLKMLKNTGISCIVLDRNERDGVEYISKIQVLEISL